MNNKNLQVINSYNYKNLLIWRMNDKSYIVEGNTSNDIISTLKQARQIINQLIS